MGSEEPRTRVRVPTGGCNLVQNRCGHELYSLLAQGIVMVVVLYRLRCRAQGIVILS